MKIRGFRIELGEIESALVRHASVREAVVLLVEDKLVAWVVPAAGAAPALSDLRGFLAQSLPDYMLPSALVLLEALPLTPHGKVDRRALPAPEAERPQAAEPIAPRTALESFVAGIWQEVLKREQIGVEDDFFELGGNSISGAVVINRLQQELGEIVQVVVIFDHPTVASVAAYLAAEHPAAVARRFGTAVEGARKVETAQGQIDAAKLSRFRELVRPRAASASRKNRRAVFVLSPPRSGSTLLRVMLAGHPKLFAPPELELLSFNTLRERSAAFTGRDSFWLEGAIRAVMEVRGCDAAAAREVLAECEREDLTTAAFYGRLQSWLGDRMLVDKTPSYALDPAVLKKAEEVFEEPLYIHLIRHPAGMIHSFVEAKLDQIFFRNEHGFSRREQAELIWLASHQNVEEHLEGIPSHRQHWVRFEDLVSAPEAELRRLCTFLGLEYAPAMAEPYEKSSSRMTDGPHAESRMLGDVKFHDHSGVDAGVAKRWREAIPLSSLSEPTLEMAARLGYEMSERVEKAAEVPEGSKLLPPLQPVSREGDLPLSFAQERLWFMDQLQPGSSAYNVPTAVRLTGRLDVAALAATLREIVRRHETLRTSFAVRDGRPVQSIAPAAGFPLPLVDAGGLAAGRREAEVREIAAAESQRPFDLRQPAMMRARLLRMGPEEHVLLLTLHHIAADGWSIGILVFEMVALYRAFSQGEPSPLPELPIQYADFAVWQRGWLQGEVLAAQLAYWRDLLVGAPALQVATDRPRTPVQSYRGGDLAFQLPIRAGEGLRALSQRRGTTSFMVLLAGFEAFLQRYSGQSDLVVGSTIANRNRRELEGLIGFFVNTLALRADLSGDPTFAELVARVRSSSLGAYAHQDLPFERLVAELQPERDLSRSPVFQVLFQLQNARAAEAVELPGLVLESMDGGGQTAKFDLVLNLFEDGLEVGGVLRYNTDLFEPATAKRLVRHFATLVTGAVTEPERPLSSLPLLSAVESHQLAREWNEAPAEDLGEGALHARFAAQAARSPEAVAVVCDGERLSYGELDRRANQLARYLVRLGVLPGDRVGLCLERSTGMLVAILGALKAGAAYVPLDPAYPRERLAFLLADSRPPVLLTQESLIADLPEPEVATRILAMDRDAAAIAREDASDPRVPISMEYPAYVIYTSGSTGRPKGVVIRHGNALRLFTATDHWFGFGREDVWTLFHSYAFDFSVWEIWGALLYGGRLVVVPYWVSRSPEAFYELLRQERVTVLNQTPSAFRQLLWAEQSAPPGAALSLRFVIFGGEALEPASLAPWFTRHGDERPRLVNMYGITETTVHVTWRELSWKDVERVAGTVGCPIPDLGVYLLDPVMRPVPIGVPGEIHVGGAGLAQGYLGRPELTAERFVPDPFGEPGSRLYRSGDLARRLPDGDLEYLGRIDHQVKIRGFRIELGEIESALARHPGVREAVVLAVEDEERPGDRRLVAWVVSAAEEAPGLSELRGFLSQSLPDYMLPSALVPLEALPLTSHGKVDRRALPAPETGRSQEGSAHREPRTELESFVAGIWREMLKLERVGVEDDFFELGGNSISGAVVINRLQQELGEIVQVVVIFDHPTVESLAGYLAAEHPVAVARRLGPEAAGRPLDLAGSAERVDDAKLARFRELVPPLAPLPAPARRNRRAVFVLSPPRSGSTLLRVMLAGHSQLFAPPELELLSFNTLRERSAAFGGSSGRDSFWLEGAIRAVMEIRGCGPEEAREILDACEQEDLTTAELYGRMQEWLGDRVLVDKTPSYALDRAILRRAEEAFEEPLYVHLIRHPGGMIRSFVEAKLDQIFFRREHGFSRRELAELIWLASHQNVEEHLREVPAERQHQVRFEDLLREPESVLRGICAFLGLAYEPAMAEPYQAGSSRMTDGPHAESRMLGDVKFHEHSGVDVKVAERWREEIPESALGELTRRMAARLGYEMAPVETAWQPIERGDWTEGEALPLSFAQERLWFLDQLDPGSPVYNITTAIRLVGDLDIAALTRALTEIMRRHSVLRTRFEVAGQSPVQRVFPASAVEIPVFDLSALPEAAQAEQVRHRVAAEGRRPFDLAHGPMVRASLLRLHEQEHVALFAMHHIASDGWSFGVLVREVAALYPAFAQEQPSPLPELPIQYADYALWQRRWLEAGALGEQLAYWRGKLAGAPPVLALPTDRPRPAVQRFRGDRHDATLAAESFAGLRQAGQSRGATLFMTLVATFAAFLSRVTDQEDLVLGTPTANRGRAELEGLIGFFVNTLVLRADLSRRPTVLDLLTRMRTLVLEAFAHQDTPFEKLVDELKPERSLSHSPLFQVMISLQNASAEVLELPGLELRPVERGQEISKFDLTLTLSESARGLHTQWRFNSELFDRSTIARLAACFRTFVEAASASPGALVAELPLLDAGQRSQILSGWSQGETVSVASRGLHEMVEEQAAVRPDIVAVAFEEGELTYAGLNRRANRLARRLRRLGVGPEVPVGLCAERSPEMIVGLLAVLKAGGSYLPLDPAYPPERLAWLLADSGVPVLLVQERLVESLPSHGAATVVLEEALEDESEENLPPLLEPETVTESLAYVIYTSGSTGTPKGVLVSHRGLDNLAEAQDRLFEVDPESRVLQFASLSFDASVSEIALAFRAGAALVLASPRSLVGPELVELLASQRITVVTLPPTVLATLPEADLPELRTLVVAGEACPVDLARRWGAGRRLVNAYGPTETTVCATAWVYDGGERLLAGRPIQNLEVYVLDSAGLPVPAGVSGELLVGGIGLARGYHGRPDLTAERFVPHPFAVEPGERLYRTGDLVRFTAEGEIEFLGRIDHQVKIRGVRVELGEVEAALRSQPGVREAVAVSRQDGSAPSRLVAYAVPSEGVELDGTALRAALATSLPEALVPSAVVVLAALPLTPSGKVDRKALPAPEGTGLAEGFVAPRTELERFLAGLWQETLGIASVGVHDDFFALGGNSITGAMFVNRLQKELGEIVHVVVMFDAPTVAKLAAYLTANYPEAVARLFGAEALGARRAQAWLARIDEGRVEAFRALILPIPVGEEVAAKNPPAAFILSPPRSGSTLLRVMLAGNPRLFAPPELELLSFHTLAERRQAFPDRNSFWLEGATRAVMEIRHCSAEEAESLLADLEGRGATTRELYRLMQEWIGDRLLVDKTPSYALDLEVLRRAEELFTEARYVHLLRHPYGMIRSFEEAKLEQVFFRHPHALERRELAELIWLVSQRNIREFLSAVPRDRQHRVRFEDLVADPEGELRGICDFLGIDYAPAMAEPYQDKSRRMTDGIHSWSRMLGDVKFHQHSGVDRKTADRWREETQEDFLGSPTWKMAEGLGYPPERRGEGSWIPIEARAVEPGRPYPLSFAQERLWVLDRMDPGSSAYNVPVGVRLEGRLDVAALAASLAEIVRRHAVLRSVLTVIDGEPAQIVQPVREAAALLPRVDLEGLPSEVREAETARLARQLARMPFDLERGPMLRAYLLRFSGEDHGAFFTMHHVASDGWSMGVLIRELSTLYAAFSAGRPSPLPELAIQYVDYARWQREWLAGPVLAEQLAYWRQALAGLDVLQLPSDRLRPPVQTFRGAARGFAVPAATARALEALGQQGGATPFMVLLAAFAALLQRYSGQDDVALGTPTANRAWPQLEELIGFFVNTLVLRADLSGGPSYEELLGRVRATALAAYANQELPFEKVVFELQPERNLSASPLFQVMFMMQNLPMGRLDLPGLTLHSLGMDAGATKFDLTLTMVDRPEGLAGSFAYNVDLFDRATIDRMAGHFQELLAAVAVAPDRRLAELSLLPEAERRQLLVEWNATGREIPPGCIHEWIAAQAARTPEAVAVVFGGESLTYRQLDRRANGLALRLLEMGVGPEVRVGIALERSLEMVVVLLGVLKAGGAYVPLDPSYPAERLAFMQEDSGLALVLTEESLPAAPEVVRAPRSGVGEDNTVYVIYTSGSTGRPKGVQIFHGALTNFLASMAETPGLTSEDRLLAVTSLSFDIAGLDLYLPLMVGGQVVLASRQDATDGRRLQELIAESGATVLQATPATWRLLLESGWQGGEGLKALCGGEALSPVLAAALRQRVGSLWNVYGPTEITVWATVEEICGEGPILIGKPIANTMAYVLDGEGQPVPVGVPGELLLGGAGLARSYLGRPDMTAERFVPSSVGEAGSRLYRTGDLARYRADGRLECLGRIDYQVKVRGFRIELGEIETALARHPEVTAAVVVAREESSGDRRLVAYVVPRRAGAELADELRGWVRQSLPEYMVPAAWVHLAELPLTPNGKVDRKALPAPVSEASAAGLRTPTEEVLAGIWARVLGLTSVGAEDSFFHLGGHSLLATQVISRVREAFGVELPLRQIFETPTLAGLARSIDATRAGDFAAPPLVPVSREEDLPLSFAQQRLWLLDQLAPGNPFYNLPGAMRLTGELDVEALRSAVREVVQRHETLRTGLASVDGKPVQRIEPVFEMEVPLEDLSDLPKDEREAMARRRAAEVARQPFDLSRPSLLRVVLLKLGEAEHALLFAMHHIVSDNWSLGVLTSEVARLYAAFAQGQPSPLPELPVQYADFAVWQRGWLQGEALERQLGYWEERLTGAPVVELPTDRPRPPMQSFRGATHRLVLAVELSSAVGALARDRSVSPFMVLLSTFQSLVCRYTGQEDVVVGTPIANRTRAELEGLIGFFVNTLVLRTDLGGDPSVSEILPRVREAALGGYAHQDLPFEYLVERLQPQRDLSRNPLFQLMFNLLNAPVERMESGSLALSPLETQASTSLFDLQVYVRETPRGLSTVWEYATDLFDASTMERLAWHFGNLLGGIVERPEARLSELPLLDEAERDQIVVEWNATGREIPSGCVHEWIAAQAARTPEAMAVVFGGESLTYRQLDQRANGLALAAAGVGSRAGGAGGHRPGAIAGDGGGAVGGAEGRRRLRAARSVISGGTVGFHGGGRGLGRGAGRGVAARCPRGGEDPEERRERG